MSLPKEPFLSAYLEVLRQAVSYSRFLALRKESHEQIADLLDAVHSIPELLNKWEKCDTQSLRAYLEAYDNKWAKKPETFSLIAVLENTFNSLKVSPDKLKGNSV
jgi:hypothetical protein